MGEYAAIPTVYAGIQFRSRLEATWAAFFDLEGWRWAYEPIDLAGYIPDFLIAWPIQDEPWLVEIKPALTLQELSREQGKIERSGWQRPAFLLGGDQQLFSPSPKGGYATGFLGTSVRRPGWHWYTCRIGTTEHWAEAKNRTQWKGKGR